MAEITSLESLAYDIPDDVTLVQFTLDVHHPARGLHPQGTPWLIQDETGRKVGREEIIERVFGLANGLSIEHGIREDDVVCIFSPNHIDYPIAIWAAHRLGAVVSAANPSYTADELEYQITASKASVIIAHPASLPVALAAAARTGISPKRVIALERVPGSAAREGVSSCEDLIALGRTQKPNFVERKLAPGEGKTKLAFLSFSSGTTGRPKAVAISHTAPIANIIQMAQHNESVKHPRPPTERRYRPGDTAIACLPFFHIYGLVVVLHTMVFSGLSLVVVPKFEFVKFLDSIVKYRITHLFLVPPIIVLLCKHPAVPKYNLSHVRNVTSGAAPLSGALTSQLTKLFPNAEIGQGYGMTETCTSVTMLPASQRTGVSGSAGRLVPGSRARVVRADGTLAGVGEVGELWVTGPSMALCYANNAQATAETFVDGWVRTGDEVYISAAGDLFVVDRLKEIMKVRGFQVAPAELEGHLLKHPDVVDACVVGVPDDYSGEVPLAFVALSADAAARAASGADAAAAVKASIAKWVADNKVAYKKLAGGIEFVDVIPKNPSGKLLRRVLREKAKTLRASSSNAVKAKL